MTLSLHGPLPLSLFLRNVGGFTALGCWEYLTRSWLPFENSFNAVFPQYGSLRRASAGKEKPAFGILNAAGRKGHKGALILSELFPKVDH